MAVVVGFLVTPAARHDVAETSSSAVVQRVWACPSGRSDLDPRSTAVFSCCVLTVSESRVYVDRFFVFAGALRFFSVHVCSLCWTLADC